MGIKSTLRSYIKRKAQDYGLYFYIHYLPNSESIFDYLSVMPTAIRFYELKKICNRIRENNNHKLYNEILKRYIKDLNIDFTETEFVGVGGGMGNLNVYRKVTFSTKTYFEKIYFSESEDLKRYIWLNENVFPILIDYIKFPTINKIYSGSFISAIYFEYIQATVAKEIDKTTLIIESIKSLYKLSIRKDSEKIIEATPNFILDYEQHTIFKKNASCEFFKEENICVHSIKKIIEANRKVFSHGDLKKENISVDNFLLDWDSFGVYPASFDVGFAYYMFIVTKADVESPGKWLINNYKSVILVEDWEAFKIGFFYFTSVFLSVFFVKGKYTSVREELLMHLKTYQAKYIMT